ncbi:MAG: adenylyltransferase/cytidyltransferase family protein [Campylobacteraceae bacterium]|jgi:[citrate (pro-3S)-lyase] ligase|nr:adenylyltransferase/cytidyltransferase family protein [Campylobacteraceae bacterium]
MPAFVIDKKAKEFGEDIFGISYKAFIENSILYIKLSVQSNIKLQFSYRLYNISFKIAEISYTNIKNVRFQLINFGQLRIRVFVKKMNSLENDYAFLSTYINYDDVTAIRCLKSGSKYYTWALSSILEVIDKINENKKNIQKIMEKLYTISSFNYNILNYFKERDINSISIFGIKEDFELSKFILLNSRFMQDLNIKYLLSYASFSAGVISVPKRINIKYTKLDDRISFLDKNDTILICTVNKDSKIFNKIKKKTNSKVIYLIDIISEVLTSKLFVEPLVTIQNIYNELKIVFCLLPKLTEVKNKSKDELKTIDGFWKKNQLLPPALSRFNYSEEYNKSVTSTFLRIERNGIFYAKDVLGLNRNIVNNFRLTTDQPNNFKNTVYIFGNSVIFGLGVSDEKTISSSLQRIINAHFEEDISYCVINCANHGGEDFDQQIALMKTMNFKKGDIVVCVSHSKEILKYIKSHFIVCQTQQAFEHPHDMGEVFYENKHLNEIGNQKIAELLFETMQENHLFDEKSSDRLVKAEKSQSNSFFTMGGGKKSEAIIMRQAIIPREENENLVKYKNLLLNHKSKTKGKIGSIVMNCNPFTLGHEYLVEASCKKVDHLYIFVVEEDKSFFSFKDRFELVQKGTKKFENITVIPSGRFIISSLTFEAYSNKEKLQEETIDVSNDVNIFVREIAPVLDITVRFAGEEPFDNVTRQYNNTMKMILPKYDIDFEIIERVEFNNEPISASKVRNLLKEKNFDEIAKIVPKTTLEYLVKNFGNISTS